MLNDDPQLNVRYVKGRDPLRIVLDSRLQIAGRKSEIRNSKTDLTPSQRDYDAESALSWSRGAVQFPNFKVLKDKNVLIATTRLAPVERVRELRDQGYSVWVSPTGKLVCLKKLMRHLGSIGISSVLVEPGPTLNQSFKKSGLIDDLIVMKGKKKVGKGVYWRQ